MRQQLRFTLTQSTLLRASGCRRPQWGLRHHPQQLQKGLGQCKCRFRPGNRPLGPLSLCREGLQVARGRTPRWRILLRAIHHQARWCPVSRKLNSFGRCRAREMTLLGSLQATCSESLKTEDTGSHSHLCVSSSEASAVAHTGLVFFNPHRPRNKAGRKAPSQFKKLPFLLSIRPCSGVNMPTLVE